MNYIRMEKLTDGLEYATNGHKFTEWIDPSEDRKWKIIIYYNHLAKPHITTGHIAYIPADTPEGKI